MAIFHKTRVLGIRFWVLALLSVAIMIGDYRHVVIPKLRPVLQIVIDPLQYVVSVPHRVFSNVQSYVVMQHELVNEKKHWQDQKLVMEARLQELNALKIQNQELQSLLKTTPVQKNQQYLLARVESINSDGLSHQVVLDRGSNDSIAAGQAVLAGNGIVGQVVQVNPLNSRVMLLTDSKAAIPAVNQRTQENLIVTGTGGDELTVLNVSTTSDLKVGDLLLSSGMGGHYPAGSPIGIVSRIAISHTNTSKVFIKPTANMNQLRQVLVVAVSDRGKSS